MREAQRGARLRACKAARLAALLPAALFPQRKVGPRAAGLACTPWQAACPANSTCCWQRQVRAHAARGQVPKGRAVTAGFGWPGALASTGRVLAGTGKICCCCCAECLLPPLCAHLCALPTHAARPPAGVPYDIVEEMDEVRRRPSLLPACLLTAWPACTPGSLPAHCLMGFSAAGPAGLCLVEPWAEAAVGRP